jgi:ribokinase
VDTTGQNRIWVIKGANDLLLPHDVDTAADVLATADCIVLQLEIPIETVYYTLRFAQQRGIRTILNPAPAQALEIAEIARATYVIPNETEAEALAGREVRTLDDARACAESILKTGITRAIITLGAAGALMATPERVQHVPAMTVTPVDTTGAGDAFIGAFATFLAAGCDEFEAVARSNVYAALSTTANGTQSSFATLQRFEAAWAESRAGAGG